MDEVILAYELVGCNDSGMVPEFVFPIPAFVFPNLQNLYRDSDRYYIRQLTYGEGNTQPKNFLADAIGKIDIRTPELERLRLYEPLLKRDHPYTNRHVGEVMNDISYMQGQLECPGRFGFMKRHRIEKRLQTLIDALHDNSRYKFYARLLDMDLPVEVEVVPEARKFVEGLHAQERDHGLLFTAVHWPMVNERLVKIYDRFLEAKKTAETGPATGEICPATGEA